MNTRKRAPSYLIPILLLSILVETPTMKAVIASSIESIRPRDADLNSDGVVNMQDFCGMTTHFGSYPGHAKWNPQADISGDGSVNVLDVILATSMFGERHALTHVVAYVPTFTDETAAFIASNFDLVITGFEAASTIYRIKALKPNITVLAYKNIIGMAPHQDDWPVVDSHEDWFLHDIHGNRLRNRRWGWYAMDVESIGWRNHYASYVEKRLNEYPATDGIFADDTWDAWRNSVWTVPKEDVPDISGHWRNDIVEILEHIKSAIGDKLLIANTGRESPDDYVDVCNGIMFEGFIHPSWWSVDYFGPSDFDPISDMNALTRVSDERKYFLAHSGASEIRWDAPQEPAKETMEKAYDIAVYCFAFFLLGIEDEHVSFGFENIFSKDGSRGYYPELDAPLGSPVDKYHCIDSVLARDYTDGKVLVNPTNSSYTVNLNNEYKTLDGHIVSNVTLDERSGIILLKP